jgi:hypothetical protein
VKEALVMEENNDAVNTGPKLDNTRAGGPDFSRTGGPDSTSTDAERKEAPLEDQDNIPRGAPADSGSGSR